MKKVLVVMAALVLAAACSVKEDPIFEETPVQEGKIVTLTATLSPKGDSDTKALTDPGDGTLSSTWAVNEELLVRYTNSSNDDAYVKATVTAVDGSGCATVSVPLTSPIEGNSTINFFYPYSSSYGDVDAYFDQIGTLADVSANYDTVVGEGTLTVTGGTPTLPSSVPMERQNCVWKFTFSDGSNDITSSITSLKINDGGGMPFTITPSSLSEIYVALFPDGTKKAVTITATTASGAYSSTKAITLAPGKMYTTTGLVLTKQNNVDLSGKTANYTASNGDVLQGVMNAAYRVIIPDGVTVTLSDATINYEGYDGAAITCLGDATIIIADNTTNSVSVPGGQGGGPDGSDGSYPGIRVGGSGKKLTITGAGHGELEVIGGYIAAGIGCLNLNVAGTYFDESAGSNVCGVIQIDGGVINAYSGYKTAKGDGCETGIGSVCGGAGDLCEGIIINGGTITAKGGTAGIGCSGGATCNFITINGGTVNATGGDGAGIGSAPSANVLKITINGGEITAYGGGGSGCPGIGASSYSGNCGPITITGGTIYSYGGLQSAGIGSGDGGTCGNINISGGTIQSVGDGPGIGAGKDGSCGNITITGGDITAVSSAGWSPALIAAHEGNGAGIGTGWHSTCGTISISGGTVVANGGMGAAGIGTDGGTEASSYMGVSISNGITQVTATRGAGGTANVPIGRGDSDSTSPNPVFTSVTKDDVNSTDDTWIYK